MSTHFIQHRGNDLNKMVEQTGIHENVKPVAESVKDTVDEITEDEYMILKACHGNMDYLLLMVKRLTGLMGGQND